MTTRTPRVVRLGVVAALGVAVPVAALRATPDVPVPADALPQAATLSPDDAAAGAPSEAGSAVPDPGPPVDGAAVVTVAHTAAAQRFPSGVAETGQDPASPLPAPAVEGRPGGAVRADATRAAGGSTTRGPSGGDGARSRGGTAGSGSSGGGATDGSRSGGGTADSGSSGGDRDGGSRSGGGTADSDASGNDPADGTRSGGGPTGSHASGNGAAVLSGGGAAIIGESSNDPVAAAPFGRGPAEKSRPGAGQARGGSAAPHVSSRTFPPTAAAASARDAQRPASSSMHAPHSSRSSHPSGAQHGSALSSLTSWTPDQKTSLR